MASDDLDFAVRDVTPFDVEIVIQSAAVIERLASSENAITSFSLGDKHAPADVRFRIGKGMSDPRPVGILHDGRRVAAEFLAIALLQDRIGILMRDMILASKKGLEHLDHPDRFFYDRSTGTIGVEEKYLRDLFDLSVPSQERHPFFFDINEVGLSSPVRARSSIKAYATAVFLGTRTIMVPVEAAAPVEMTVAQSVTSKSLLDSASVLISAANLGFTVYTHYHPDGDPNEKYRQKIEDEIYDNLHRETRQDDVRLLQSILKQMNLYDGKIDGDAGPKTLSAVKAFAQSVGLPSDTPRNDPQFLRILSHRASKSTVWRNLSL